MKSGLTLCSTKNLNPEVVQLLRENSIDVLISGRTKVKHHTDVNKILGLKGVIVCTSRHAVQCLTLQKVDIKHVTGIFCLSGSTLAAARELQVPILGTAHDASSLAMKILESGTHQVTFLCSEDHRPELPNLLQERGVQVDMVIAYSIKFYSQKTNIPFDVILFFSPKSVETFLQQNVLPKNVTCFCIGQTTARFLRLKTNRRIIVSPFPSQEYMVKQVIRFAQSTDHNKSPEYAVV